VLQERPRLFGHIIVIVDSSAAQKHAMGKKFFAGCVRQMENVWCSSEDMVKPL